MFNHYLIRYYDKRQHNRWQKKPRTGRARRIERLEIEYWIYYESWLDADQKAVDLAPRTMYDDFTQSWSEAIIKRESLKETLDWLDFKRRAMINGQ